jgi:hypothetical protein
MAILPARAGYGLTAATEVSLLSLACMVVTLETGLVVTVTCVRLDALTPTDMVKQSRRRVVG